jgi:Fe2+ or Zn2+ uptake regulation protein
MGATADLHETAAGRLRGVAQRYTKNRQAVVEVLATTDRPLTIPELLDHDDRLAQSSAYRNLAVLEQAGVVHRIVTSDEFARYELAEDLTGHHHHLICSRCGGVEDFTASKHLERSLERAVHQVVSDTGFTVEHHRLDLIGQCGDCRR